jgi:hypothetical protein
VNINKLLTPAVLRLINDYAVEGEIDLGDLLDEIRTVKGPRKPTGMNNPCFTAHILSNSRDETSKIHRGTMRVNFYCDNYDSGNAKIELMSTVTDRVITLFDDEVFSIDGYRNFTLDVQEPLGPLFNPNHSGEHYMSIRLRFILIKL